MDQLILILCGVFGVLFQCATTIRSLQKDALAANASFNWKKDYLRKDAFAIVAAFLSVAIWFLVFNEVAAKYPALEGLTRTSFVLMGGIGSWAIQKIFGTAKARIRAIVDHKTNELDKIKGEQ